MPGAVNAAYSLYIQEETILKSGGLLLVSVRAEFQAEGGNDRINVIKIAISKILVL